MLAGSPQDKSLHPLSDAAARAYAADLVKRSGSSFTWGMRLLPKVRREAMYAIYAFCREVDDIADEPGEVEEKRRQLDDWREEVRRLYEGEPTKMTGFALLGPVRMFDLPRSEFLAVIDGMEMDARDAMVAPSMEEFILYCRRVAGAVGMLSIRAFGAEEPAAEKLAVVLGEALQFTNVLRDLAEDAKRGRLYLPDELLTKHGIAAREPMAVCADPALPSACADLAHMAQQRFDESARLIGKCRRRRLRPAILMMEVYRRLLERLAQSGWRDPARPVEVPAMEKLWVALRYGFF